MNRPLPEDPMIRSLIAQAKRAQVSRRAMLAGTGAGATALALAACAPASTELTPAEDNSANDPNLNWANWPLYIDEDDDGKVETGDTDRGKATPAVLESDEESAI